MLQRDIMCGEGGTYYTQLPYREDETFYEREVLRVCPNAFIKRTVNKHYGYQVKLRKYLIFSESLGLTHYFKDQAWQSAYAKLKELGKL